MVRCSPTSRSRNVADDHRQATEAAIVHELAPNGSTILVPGRHREARVALARDAMPDAGRPGLELFDKRRGA